MFIHILEHHEWVQINVLSGFLVVCYSSHLKSYVRPGRPKVLKTPSFRFEGIRLLQYQTFGLFVIFCQVVFVLFVIYFTGRELVFMYQQRCKYFQNYWSYAEMAIIVACYLGIVIYVLRSVFFLHSASVHAGTLVECSEYQMRNSRVSDKP